MFGWLFRNEGELIALAADKTYATIHRQKTKIEKDFSVDVSQNPRLRWATDSFVAGYAMGLSRRFLAENKMQVSNKNYDSLENDVSKRLESLFSCLNIKMHTKVPSKVPVCGMKCGWKELGPASDSKIMEEIWSMLLARNMSVGISLRQYAHGRISTDLDEFEIIGEVGDRMQERYQNGPAPQYPKGYYEYGA